jgi:hypothetical protein
MGDISEGLAAKKYTKKTFTITGGFMYAAQPQQAK